MSRSSRDDTIDYLRRWRLLDTRWGRVYLHHFIECDDAAEPLG